MQSQQNFLAVVAVSHGDDATRDDGVRIRGGPPWPRQGWGSSFSKVTKFLF